MDEITTKLIVAEAVKAINNAEIKAIEAAKAKTNAYAKATEATKAIAEFCWKNAEAVREDFLVSLSNAVEIPNTKVESYVKAVDVDIFYDTHLKLFEKTYYNKEQHDLMTLLKRKNNIR